MAEETIALCQNCGNNKVEQKIEVWHRVNAHMTKESLWKAMIGAEGGEDFWCPECNEEVNIHHMSVHDTKEANHNNKAFRQGELK